VVIKVEEYVQRDFDEVFNKEETWWEAFVGIFKRLKEIRAERARREHENQFLFIGGAIHK